MLTTDKDTKTPKIESQDKVTIGEFAGHSIYQQNCPHFLPCGICERTNKMCPLNGWRSFEPVWTTTNKCEGGK